MWLIREVKSFIAAMKPVTTGIGAFTKSLENGMFAYDTPRTALRDAGTRIVRAVHHADLQKLEPAL